MSPACGNQSQIDLSTTALGQQHLLSQNQSFDENAETFTISDEHFTRPTLANCHSTSTDSGFDDAEIVQDRPIETNTSKPSRIRGFSFTKSTKSRTSSVSSVASVKRPDVTTCKERHLPTVSENVSSIENQVYFYQPDMIWQTFGVLKGTWAWGVVSSLGNNVRKVLDWGTPRFLSRRNQRNATPSPSSPEINPSPPGIASSQHLQNLFIEAMLILQEAEVEGFAPTDETSL